jgi:hypothetical protein
MKFRVCLSALCVGLALQAQISMNVQQLADFVRSEIALKQHTDKQIAAYLKKVQLTERLTDKAIADLDAQGAQPKTLEALRALRDQTASMKKTSPDATYSPATAPDNTLGSGPETTVLKSSTPAPPPPNSVQREQIIDAMKQYAASYTSNLPNFICVEVVRQGIDPRGGASYQTIGHILSKVSYNEGNEHNQVYSLNGKMIDIPMERVRVGGAVSSGEFGTLMQRIFDPKSEATFEWDHWAKLRGRTMAVFSYFIDSGHSDRSIAYSSGPGDEQTIITAYKGLIYADANTGEIDRIKFVAVDIPKTFPVTQTTEILDFDLVDISGQQYVVPLRALLTMRTAHESTRNEIDYRNYRKFGTESVITYDTAPLPESKTEEQPLSAPTKPAQPASSETTAATQKQPGTTAKPPASSSSSPWELPAPPPPPPPQ